MEENPVAAVCTTNLCKSLTFLLRPKFRNHVGQQCGLSFAAQEKVSLCMPEGGLVFGLAWQAAFECPGRVSALPVVVIKSFTASRRNATAILEVFI